MFITSHERLAGEIRDMAQRLGRNRSSLVPILQEVQKQHHRIGTYAMQVIANELGIHPVEVQSVVSFYAFLDGKPQGRFVIRLCRTISCDMNGKKRVARQLENDLGITFGETTKDRHFTLEWTNCMGLCDQGPALLVNDRLYTKVTPEKIHEILEECRRTFGAHATEQREAHLV